MLVNRKQYVPGYVKVELRSRFPKLWSWALYREGSDLLIEQSDVLFQHAEDAWKAGQAILSELKPVCRQDSSETHRTAYMRRHAIYMGDE